MMDHRVCFVGDSFVLGTGDPECLGWVGRVVLKARSEGWDLTFYNLGIRRNTSRDILARWEQECTKRLPSDTHPYLVFSFGVNDSLIENGSPRIPLQESKENFQRLISTASSDYSVLMVGPPPIGEAEQNSRIQELSQSFDTLAANLDVPYLSVYDHLHQDALWMGEVEKNDGAHPGAKGYQRLAEFVSQWSCWWFHSQEKLMIQDVHES